MKSDNFLRALIRAKLVKRWFSKQDTVSGYVKPNILKSVRKRK